jgi:hypothetical protein
MKKYRLLIAIIAITMATCMTCRAGTLFQEKFISKKGTDVPISTIQWHCHYGSDGTSVDEKNIDIYGGVVVAASDFLATQYDQFSGQPVLIWTDKEKSFGAIEEVSSVCVSFKNQSTSVDFKIALKIGDRWYVSQQVLNGTGSFVPQTLDVKSDGWNSLAFEPGNRLEEGGSVELPSQGEIKAIGLFDAIGGPSGYGGRIRISEFSINK